MKKVFYLFGLVIALAVVIVSCEKQIDPLEDNGEGTLKTSPCKIYVPGDYTTIQNAVDAATDGCEIFVDAGTYYEQVEIRDLNNIKITGDDATITVPTSGMTGPLVKFYNCQGFKFSGFTIDGANGVGVGYGASNGGGDADTRFYGLLAINSSGEIKNNEIYNISWHNGVQQGLGMYVFVTDGVERDIHIKNNLVENFQKGGISVRGAIDSKIFNNTVTHWCEIGIIAGNGIQVDGGKSMIQGNDISCSKYYDEDEFPLWSSTAVLLIAWYYPAEDFKVINNDITDSDTGVYVIDYGAGLGIVKVINNTFSGNIWDGPFGPENMKIHANKYE